MFIFLTPLNFLPSPLQMEIHKWRGHKTTRIVAIVYSDPLHNTGGRILLK